MDNDIAQQGDLKEGTKVRPISFTFGLLVGILAARLSEVKAEGLAEVIAQHPISWYVVGGTGLTGIRYADHMKAGIPRQDTISNCKIGLYNYSIGYALGYAANRLVM